MNLFLHELTHLFSSLLIGILVWKYWGKHKSVFIAAILGGFLIDIDHLFDYVLAFGAKFNVQYFLKGYHFLKNDKIIVLLHSWELVIILFFIVIVLRKNFNHFKPLVIAFALAMFFHLLTDAYQNNIPFQSYFLTKRFLVGFKIEKLVHW